MHAFECGIWLTCFFLSFKERIIETYPELFGESNGDQGLTKAEGFSKKWGWYSSLYGLAEGNILRFDEITKQKLHRCLQQLAFEKDKAELQEHMLKAKTKR